ncbi:MAG: hypothetical protein JOY62_05575 [Acidobacteriaceae bacterium]|nr:hypothetical protein [Acidobacteriaceae bacterium]MBV9779427.1 hypothetical protein [Acidobacteriaceae bacterium]
MKGMSRDPEEILKRSDKWMRSQAWHKKLAKSATGQSLLEHTLIELDVFLSLEPILANPKTFALSDTERSIVLGALLCHDIGKASELWQRYVRGEADEYVPHIDKNLLRSIAPEVCAVIGADSVATDVERTVELCARYHHSRPERDDATILEALLDGTPSFLPLAHIVMDIDRLCSAQTPQSAVSHIRASDLGKHISAEWHQLSVRGVSSTFFHKAVQQAFEAAGWRPLIYFGHATVYFADRAEDCVAPNIESIRKNLERVIADTFTREVSSLIVGNPTANILPKPDLVSWNETRTYLEQAGRKMSPSSFAKKRREARVKVIEKYLDTLGASVLIDDDTLERQSQRISHAQPEMVVFKLFKALTDTRKVPELGDQAAQIAAELYEKVFGKGTWQKLQSTSTLMPANDMAATVDSYWDLDAGAIGRAPGTKIETLPDKERMSGLITVLDRIIEHVVKAVGAVSPRNALAASMASAFLRDLVYPSETSSDPRIIAGVQVEHYSQSKPIAGKDKDSGAFTCPICNCAFESGRKASADFIDNPQSHTNRGVSHGAFGYVVVCKSCYYERLLRQVLMETRPAEIITLLPPWNIGPRNGDLIVKRVHAMVDQASAEMRGETGDVTSGFSFSLTEHIARRMEEKLAGDAGTINLISLFRYRVGSETARKRKRELELRLQEEYGGDLAALNAMCGTRYSSWGAVLDAVSSPGPLPDDLHEIRREILRLDPNMGLACETPNLVFIPLTYEIGSSDESDANKALRRLFAALLIHTVFGATVAIHSEPSDIDPSNAVGAAWVPPVPAVRNVIGTDWISADSAELWLERIGAAARLAQATGYPSRSAMYQTFITDPAEKVMQRIESQRGIASPNEAELIRKLPFFRTSTLYMEAQA